jgi:hypothetical protein
MIAASSSMASVTFAQYSQTNGSQQQWSISEATSGSIVTTTVSATGNVQFTFSGVAGLPFSGAQAATLSLSATSTQIGNCGTACATNDSYTEPGYSGTFSFTDVALGTDLLSGTFSIKPGSASTTGAQLGSTIGGHGGSFDASDDSGNLTQISFASTYLSFANVTTETASWSLSSLETALGAGFAVGTVTAGQAYPSGTYGAAATGTFSTTPAPTATPEPASLSLIGAGLIGFGVLRRRKVARS